MVLLQNEAPELGSQAADQSLARLTRPGDILDSRLSGYCSRLEELFRVFATTCPAPAWAPGLAISQEIRSQSERYLPLADIRIPFNYLCSRACRYQPFWRAMPFNYALSWPDALQRLSPWPWTANPASLLARLARDENCRRQFLAAVFVPAHYGGGACRYPQQTDFLCRWLTANRERLSSDLAVLDAACGSGEGTYGVAESLLTLGYSPSFCRVEGVTVEPLELVAAKHGWFPLDAQRGRQFQSYAGRLLERGGQAMIRFRQEDIICVRGGGAEYDVIICNGLLGGPLLHERDEVLQVLRNLIVRLRPRGLFLAADRFHGGWRKNFPPAALVEMLHDCDLSVQDVGEGVGAIRP